MCRNDITFAEVIAVLKEYEEGHRWKRDQLHDEWRDCAADPEMADYVSVISRDISYETGCIATLCDLIKHLADDVELMRLEAELERTFS